MAADKPKMVSLTKEEVDALAGDSSNIVYEVKHDDVEYTTMKDVKRLMGVVRSLAQQLYEEGLSEEAVRAEIRSRSQEADKMASLTHPRLFLAVTKRDIEEKTVEMIAQMISLRERVETGEITSEDATTAMYVKMLQQNGV